MQRKEALKLNEQCGNKFCEHKKIEKEYELGVATGDYVCTKCGESGWGNLWNKRLNDATPESLL